MHCFSFSFSMTVAITCFIMICYQNYRCPQDNNNDMLTNLVCNFAVAGNMHGARIYAQVTNRILHCQEFIFIGPRYTWGPIYGSESLSLTEVCETYSSYTSYRLYTTNASGAIWWPNLELMQVAPSGGQFCN